MNWLQLIDNSVNAYFACRHRQKPSQNQLEALRLVAHRGAHGKHWAHFENTDAAFALAKQLGCWGIELDVHATADGVLVVNHDPDLKRLWGLPLVIGKCTFAELREQAPLVPSLEEVIQRYGQEMHLFIELKAPFEAFLALKQTLEPLVPIEQYHLISMDADLLKALEDLPKEALLLVAGFNNTEHFCELSLQKHYGGVLGHYLLLNDSRINRLSAAKQQVGVGFIDSKYSLYREAGRAVTWIFSDNVARLIPHLGANMSSGLT